MVNAAKPVPLIATEIQIVQACLIAAQKYNASIAVVQHPSLVKRITIVVEAMYAPNLYASQDALTPEIALPKHPFALEPIRPNKYQGNVVRLVLRLALAEALHNVMFQHVAQRPNVITELVPA